MIVLPDGTAYVGNVAWRDHRQTGTDAIIQVHVDGSSRVVADHADMPLMEQPNGMAITSDRRTLIFATSRYGRETADLRVTAMTIDDDGSLSNARVFARREGLDPDGLCVDADGAIWLATLSGNSFLRVLDGGQVTDVVPVGDRLAVACTLGGPSGTTLFMLCVSGERGPNLRSEAVGSIDIATVDSVRAGWP
jgi:sugar lactone lactonase YvrE